MAEPMNATGHSVGRRPIVGIAVGAIFGLLGLLWSSAQIFKALYTNTSGPAADLYRAFPPLQDIAFFGSSLGMLGNSVLLIGVLLALMRHVNAARTVRMTSRCMLGAILATSIASYLVLTRADAWQLLDPRTKGGLIGGLIGGLLGGGVQWGLVLFFFREKASLARHAAPTSGG